MTRKPRFQVAGKEGPRPFLRGMLTQSLLKRGLGFEEAYAVANIARKRLADKAEEAGEDIEVSTAALRKLVLRIVRETYGKKRMRALEQARHVREPEVVHSEGTVPFSRGLLSQKLIGTGLDPRLAYEVAQEVWTQLRRRPDASINEEALSRLERQIVVERHGESFGQRYDAIDHIATSSRPIIVLVGGGTGCGKSTLAMEIAYQLGIRKIASTDMIREIMRRLLSPEILPAIHTSSYQFRDTHAEPDPVIAGFLEQVIRVDVGIGASIRRAVLENFHLIVEGVHVVPPFSAAEKYGKDAHIIPVTLATLDREVLASRFKRRGKEQGGARRARRYLASLDDIMRIQDFIVDQADQHDVPILENVSFDETAADLLKLITDHIHSVISPKGKSS